MRGSSHGGWRRALPGESIALLKGWECVMANSGEAAGAKGPGEQALAAAEALLKATRSLAGWVTQTGAAGAQAVVPDALTGTVEHWIGAVQAYADNVPRIGDEFAIVMQELHAKRLTIQAMSAELAVLDAQLEVLERALAPMEAWNDQWDRILRAAMRPTDRPSTDKA